MDYDKLIEELYDGAHPQNKNWKAATAIETLRADLARVTAERDAAIKDLNEGWAYVEADSFGDDYELDRRRELMELYKNVPHICDYCIGCEIEPTDGHGCDGYDNFVFSVRRIVAALKAREQDG